MTVKDTLDWVVAVFVGLSVFLLITVTGEGIEENSKFIKENRELIEELRTR